MRKTTLLAATIVTLMLAAGPAHASAWIDVEGLESLTVNPCTGAETTLTLFDVQLLISGTGDEHEGFKFRGSFATGDGFTGSFLDLDQANTVPDPVDDNVFTAVVVFVGSNDAHQGVRFTSELQVVIRDGGLVNLVALQRLTCVGRPA